MSDRLRRLRLLTKELLHEVQRLASTTTSGSTLVFLDRLVRCEAYPPDEQERAGVRPIIEAAAATREAEAASLGSWAAAGLDLEGLLDRGYRLAEGPGEEGEVVRWAWDLLLVANVAPYLEEPARNRALEVIEDALDLIEAHPARFREAASVAEDRESNERPGRIPDTLGKDLLRAFAETPELAAYDDSLPDASKEDPMERWLRSVPPERLTEADEALRQARDWSGEVIQLRRAARAEKEAEVEDLDRIRFAASSIASLSDGVGEYILLRRWLGGELVLSREGAEVFLEWYGPETPVVSFTPGAPSAADPIEGGLRWRLPEGDEELRIDVAIGPNRIELVIPH